LLALFSGGSSELARNLFMTPILGNPSGIWGEAGWLPIGQGEGAFQGRFDGNGHRIDGLRINRPDDFYVGLFGTTYDDGGEFGPLGPVSASIQNLALTNVDITGAGSTGALVGLALNTTFAQIYVTGQVNGTDDNTGGIFGSAFGGRIDNAVSFVDVTGTTNVGGLVGSMGDGFVAAYSYAHGPVTGSTAVGGLVGFTETFATLDQTFATGQVTGTSQVGGLVGNNGGTVIASFWDRTSTRRNTPFGQNSAGAQQVTGLTTAQFQNTLGFMTLASGQGWNFATDWAPSVRGFYPANYTIEPVVYVRASSVSRTYGASNAGILVNGRFAGGPADYVFDLPGDTLTVNRATLLSPFGAALPVGFYTYGSRGDLISADGIAYRVVATTGLNVTPAPLTLTPDDIFRIYGDADPTLTFDISGFVLGQGTSLLTGSIARLPGEDVGTYAFTLGTLSAGANYTINIAGMPGLTITPRSLTLAADDITTIFGQPFPDLTFTIVDGQLVFNDALTGEPLAEGATGAPGTFTIGQGTLTAGGNYAITFIPGTLTVSPARNRDGTLERSTDNFIPIDFDTDTITDPFFTPPDTGLAAVGPSFSSEGTDAVVDQMQQATAYCSVIGQSEYVIDCLSERLAVIAAGLPDGGDYAEARSALNTAAARLSELVAANEDSDFPANLTRSLRPDAPPSSRPLRPVRTDSLADTLAAASGILAETQTQLLRSASASSESVHFQRIATAVGSTNTILLRSS
jgi:hypothetical protein